jgi:hypothetical protein
MCPQLFSLDNLESQARILRRPEAWPACCFRLSAAPGKGATADAKDRLDQVDSGPRRWASSWHTWRMGTPARSAATRM